MVQLVTFRVGDSWYGIPIVFVREIHRASNITPVPRVPEHFRGLINLRGQIVTIVDMSVKLGEGPFPANVNAFNVILKNRSELALASKEAPNIQFDGIEETVGLMVDEIGDIIEAEDEAIEPTPGNIEGKEAALMVGAAKKGDAVYLMLSVSALLAKPA
jgi:purine-binding chemotaxis protein CheW